MLMAFLLLYFLGGPCLNSLFSSLINFILKKRNAANAAIRKMAINGLLFSKAQKAPRIQRINAKL